MTQYKVVGAGAHATVDSPDGRRKQLHLRGTLLPPGVPESEIRHLLDVKLIAPVNTGDPAPQPGSPPDPTGQPDGQQAEQAEQQADNPPPPEGVDPPDPAGQPDGQQAEQAEQQADNPPPPEGVDPPDPAGQTDPDVDEKRAAARAKLPTDGSKPDGRHGQPVWVEWLVARGYDYDAVAGEDKAQLIELAGRL